MNMRWVPGQNGMARLEGERLILTLLTAVVMAVAIGLGGASRGNQSQVMIVEMAGLPLLAYGVWVTTGRRLSSGLIWPLALIAATVGLLVLQLIPMPDALWNSLPGHGQAVEIRCQAGVSSGWSPISLLPSETLSQLLALTTPVAIFLATAHLGPLERKWLTLAPLVMAIVSVLLGLAQVTGGAESPFYLYSLTNLDSAVGVFSNRNHQATLLIATLPLAALWFSLDRRQRRHNLLPTTFAMGFFLMAVTALIVVKSRAGVLLLAPAILASLVLIWRNERGRGRRGLTIFGAAVAGVLVLAIAFGIGPVLDRFSGVNDIEYGGRFTTAAVTFRAALEYLPFGSGAGTFVPVFAGHEDINTMGAKFWNHAHNDFMEIFLETGLFGLILLVAFIAWLGRRLWTIWSQPATEDSNVAAAASIAIGLILLHSTIEYPLRTLALASVFAFCCGLLVSPREEDRRNRR